MPAEGGIGQKTVESDIPARLDRLPWSEFHWMIIVGLGTVWILDGLEVTLVGSIASRMTEAGSGIALNASQIGTAAAIYVAGAVVGALFFGRLTDKYGRKKLFIITLGVYITATVLTAFSMNPLWFYACRFFAGSGIGGEYSAINSAIDELIPARVRGRVDLLINGSYWLGAAIAALGSIVLLDTALFAADLGWRLAFGIGGLLGITILIVRRHVPESPRWLSIHGRNEEAEEIVSGIEERVADEMDGELPELEEEPIEIRQRGQVTLAEVARTAIRDYPRRTILGLSLFVGQAFLYNAITFDLGTLLSEFFKVGAATVPFYIAAYALSNFLGPVSLGRLFDSVGRKPMIMLTYGMAALGGLALAVLMPMDGFTKWWFMAVLMFTFFFASAGASSAYLTVSEIFPMETRAMSIAVFYSVGTGLGGIIGPLLFGHLINSGNPHTLAIGFYIGAGVMLLGVIAELFFGVDAEKKSLEAVATPLSAVDSESGGEEGERQPGGETAAPSRGRDRSRYFPGVGSAYVGRGIAYSSRAPEIPPGPEVESLVAVLQSEGQLSRRALYRRVNAGRWGPGRFSQAVSTGLAQGRFVRVGRSRYATPPSDGRS